jgi:KamA family protein
MSYHTLHQGSAMRVLRSAGDERKYRVFTRKDIDSMPVLSSLSEKFRNSMKAVSAVLPFRVNNYVIEDLIDWSNIPEDPIFQLTFPQPEMLDALDFRKIYDLVARRAPADRLKAVAREIQQKLNPHPAGQLELNVPMLDDQRLEGTQHKYRETVLFFPAAGQTCHAYCTYCFRWAQFVGMDELKFASRQADNLVAYLKKHPEVTSVLITGGDPMVMKSSVLRRYIEPLLDEELEHVQSIRVGTKAPAYWPYRFVSDSDADDLLRLFDEVRRAGRHMAVMAHYSHPHEIETPIARAAVRRIKRTGAIVRTQAPLIRHVNDSPQVWSSMWRTQTRLGAVPYYMFIERNTGPKHYFEVPLARALDIFNEAYRTISGLSRTVRGPSMSATPGKVLVDGVATIKGEKVFVLKFLQGRDPEWVGRPFFARYDPEASWLSDLKPAFGESKFFFEQGLELIKEERGSELGR